MGPCAGLHSTSSLAWRFCLRCSSSPVHRLVCMRKTGTFPRGWNREERPENHKVPQCVSLLAEERYWATQAAARRVLRGAPKGKQMEKRSWAQGKITGSVSAIHCHRGKKVVAKRTVLGMNPRDERRPDRRHYVPRPVLPLRSEVNSLPFLPEALQRPLPRITANRSASQRCQRALCCSGKGALADLRPCCRSRKSLPRRETLQLQGIRN